MYQIDFTSKARFDIDKMYKSDASSYKKLLKMILEVSDDPRRGTGHPERLKNREGEFWSRRINKKDRLVYEIIEDKIIVIVVSALGHYDDK